MRLPARLCNLERLLATLEQRGLDGLVAYLRPNVFYLSSFAPPSNQSVHETNGDAPLDRFIPTAQRESAWARQARAKYAPSLIVGVRRAMHDLGLDRGRVGFDDLRLANAVGLPEVQVV